MEIYLAHAKGRGYILPVKWSKVLFNVAGYHHIPLDESSIPKTAFTSSFGKYKYIKVPFGLMQAPAYFQELMTDISKDFSITITYLDDIITFRRTAEEHLNHIKQVFKKYGMHTYQWSLGNAISLLKKSIASDTSSAPKTSDHYHQTPKP